MSIFKKIGKELNVTLKELEKEGFLPKELNYDNVAVEAPKDRNHGDVAINAAMVLAKQAKKNPREIAEKIIEKIKQVNVVNSAEIAGPGFINLKLDNSVWYKELQTILNEKVGYGNSEIGQGQKINIEYVSANPSGPMHIGHARGAVYGDALALLLLKSGYDITKEFYVNDAGAQITILAKSAYLRYQEAVGKDIGEIPEGYYPGEYLKTVGEALKQEHGKELLNMKEYEWLPIVKIFTVECMMAMVKNDLLDLGIEHDIFTSEQALIDKHKIDEAFKLLEGKGLIYEGVLDPPKGKKVEDWEPRKQKLFKATDFGDDVDRPLKKSDGSYTYFASDIGYHLDKIQRGFNKMSLVLGADHGGYVKRIKAAVKALSNDKANIDVKLCQLVNFLEDGKPAKMSKRAGTFTTVRDVIDEVGKDVVRFIMLTRKNDAVLDFDFNLVKAQTKDNPVFYVQYAHARARSVLRAANQEIKGISKDIETISEQGLAHINSEGEINLIKTLALWPKIVESAAIAQEPHRVAFYLQDVAAEFHALWNVGNEDAALRFIVHDNIELTKARLALVKAMSIVIASGLFIFNIQPVEEMR